MSSPGFCAAPRPLGTLHDLSNDSPSDIGAGSAADALDHRLIARRCRSFCTRDNTFVESIREAVCAEIGTRRGQKGVLTVPNIDQIPRALMRGLRSKAGRIATGMTRALCIVGDLPTSWFPAAGDHFLDPLAAIVREPRSDRTDGFAASSVEVASGVVSLTPRVATRSFSRWPKSSVSRFAGWVHFAQRGHAIACGGSNRADCF